MIKQKFVQFSEKINYFYIIKIRLYYYNLLYHYIHYFHYKMDIIKIFKLQISRLLVAEDLYKFNKIIYHVISCFID